MPDALLAIFCSTRLNCRPQLDRSTALARTRFECRIADGRGRRQLAVSSPPPSTFHGQLTGIELALRSCSSAPGPAPIPLAGSLVLLMRTESGATIRFPSRHKELP